MKWPAAAIATAAFFAAFPSIEAQADICANAWRQRNEIYKRNGYCFRTARAIQAFGNAGCSYDDIADVPLSARERKIVTNLRAYERSMGCTE